MFEFQAPKEDVVLPTTNTTGQEVSENKVAAGQNKPIHCKGYYEEVTL